jgi:hypothetical protein
VEFVVAFGVRDRVPARVPLRIEIGADDQTGPVAAD